MLNMLLFIAMVTLAVLCLNMSGSQDSTFVNTPSARVLTSLSKDLMEIKNDSNEKPENKGKV